MRLKNKMLFLIGLPMLLVIMILTLVSYSYSKSLLVSESRETMLADAGKYASDVETIISGKRIYVEASANNISKEQKRGKSLLDDLTYLTKNVEGGQDFFVGFNDKTFFDGSGWEADASYDPTTKDWYKGAIGHNETYISEPYLNTLNNNVITISHELKYNGQSVGVFGGDILTDDFDTLIKGIKIKETGKAYLMNKNGNFIIHDKYTLNDNISNVENGELAEIATKLSANQPEFLSLSSNKVKRYYAIYPVKNTTWSIVLEAPVNEVIKASHELSLFMAVIGVICVLVLLVIIFFIANSISTPIIRLSECVQSMVEYDFTLSDTSPSVIYSKNKDEIGVISRALIKVKNTIRDIMVQITDTANQVSASSEELTASSEQSATTSKNLAKTVEEISNGAVMQADDMQRGAEAMQVVGSALNANENIIKTLNITIKEVASAKERGILTIAQLIKATERLKDSAENVHSVILNTNDRASQISSASNMIKSISDQTNLLALNAAIEAARAGEAGKGFAVVAEEIRKLAEQSNKFTEEIQEIVQGLTEKVTETVNIMELVGGTVAEQNEKVNETKELFHLISYELDKNMNEMDNLNNSVKELESTKDSLVDIIENLSALSEENAAATQEASESLNSQLYSSEEVASASAGLADLAQNMIEMINKFKI
nr:methyl-accepting chemotaxis protein [uncultured Catonella sp.]